MKKIFITIAIIALLVQLTFPVWWAAVVLSSWVFLIEGIFEGGLFRATYYSAYTYAPLMIIFFFYYIVAISNSILSFLSLKYKRFQPKRNIFTIINILTIIIAIALIIFNKGFLIRFG